MNVGPRIRKARKDRGLTQRELAAEMSVARETLANYESGRYPVSLEMLEAVALATGQKLAWFFEDQPAEEPAAPATSPPLPAPQAETPDEEDRLARMERILGALVEQQARAAPEERIAQAVAQAVQQALEPLHDVMTSLAHGHLDTRAEVARMQGKVREMESELREMEQEDEEGDCPGTETCSG